MGEKECTGKRQIKIGRGGQRFMHLFQIKFRYHKELSQGLA